MLLLDRYILSRFFTNFAMLFLTLFVFGSSIDVIMNLDKFYEVSRAAVGPQASAAAVVLRLIALAADFEGPRIFQFYAYLHGLAAIGAMGFTLAQMHRHRELVAVMASGVSLRRIAVPFAVAVFALSVVQLLNQELLLPRLAPVLLRDYGQIGMQGAEKFPVQFTSDGKHSLMQAPQYDPLTQTLDWPTILERDDRGRTARRITAKSATWSDQAKAWLLDEGSVITRASFEGPVSGDLMRATPVDSYATDLTPEVLLIRRFTQFAGMLSLRQIAQMLNAPALPARDALLRYRYSRFSSVLVNMLVLALTLPTFLLREPANLLRQAVLCASLAIPASLGSALGMMIDLPGISPAVGVFLPVVVLGFMCLFPWTFFKT